MRRGLYILMVQLFTGLAVAQTDTTRTQGEIISGEVVIEKDKRIALPQADKVFLRSAPKEFGSQPIQVNFQVEQPTFQWPDYKSDVPFSVTDESYPLEAYQNYVKLGFGNYTSPLFEAGVFKSVGSFDTQAKVYYESFKSGPVFDENSGNSEGGIELSGTYKKKLLEVTPSVQFNTSRYSFYGNSDRNNTGFDSLDPIDSRWNSFQTVIALAGGLEDLSFSVKPFFNYSNQNLSSDEYNKETDFGAVGNLSYKIDNAFKTGFDLEGHSLSYQGGISYDRSLLNINPWVTHIRDQFSITAGFRISAGKVGSVSETSFYPQAKVNYNLTDKWAVYALVDGGQYINTLDGMLSENQFLDDSIALTIAENTIQFGGGIKGAPIKNMLIEASLTYSSVNGLPFFTPSVSDSSRYILSYDSESVGVVTLNSTLSFMPTATSTYGISVELNGYSVELLDRPWHKPSFILKAYTGHNVNEKLILSAYASTMGGIRAPANVDFGYVKLPVFVDLGLSAKYLLTKQASIFIDVNNLLNNEYERYLGYPTRGLTFKIGGQYRF